MDSSKGYMAEGHSVTRPPYFDGTDYPYWKNRMQVFLRAQNYELWKIVSKGPYVLPEDEDTWTKDQIAKGTLNWSALNMMQCAVHPKEFSRVSTCSTAKEMWDKLELIYEGTSEVRETKVSMLVSEYEMFKMKTDETISDMFARFMLIVNGLKGLKKEYSESDLVRKILRSLTSSWNTKATVIEDSKDLSKMKLDELIGSLMTYEINIKRKELEENPRKSIALKASNKTSTSSKKSIQQDSDEQETSSESDDGEMAMLTRQFKKFLKFKRRETGNSKSFPKKNFSQKYESNKKSDIVCYECKKQGHMRGECPELKKKLKKDKFTSKKAKAMLATWSDEDEDEDAQETSDDEEVKCLMARGDDSSEVNFSFNDFTASEWEEAYTTLFENFREYKSENRALKKKCNSLVHDKNNDERIAFLTKELEMMKVDEKTHNEEMDCLKMKLQEIQKEKDCLSHSIEFLQEEQLETKKKLEQTEKELKEKSEDLMKFVKGKQNLDAVLGTKIHVTKHGLGYQPVKQKKIGESLITSFIDSSPSTSKHAPTKHNSRKSQTKPMPLKQNAPNKQKKKPPVDRYNGVCRQTRTVSMNKQSIKQQKIEKKIPSCNVCKKIGHHEKQCWNNPKKQKVKQVWIPKHLLCCMNEILGPKVIWVPKPLV